MEVLIGIVCVIILGLLIMKIVQDANDFKSIKYKLKSLNLKMTSFEGSTEEEDFAELDEIFSDYKINGKVYDDCTYNELNKELQKALKEDNYKLASFLDSIIKDKFGEE